MAHFIVAKGTLNERPSAITQTPVPADADGSGAGDVLFSEAMWSVPAFCFQVEFVTWSISSMLVSSVSLDFSI